MNGIRILFNLFFPHNYSGLSNCSPIWLLKKGWIGYCLISRHSCTYNDIIHNINSYKINTQLTSPIKAFEAENKSKHLEIEEMKQNKTKCDFVKLWCLVWQKFEKYWIVHEHCTGMYCMEHYSFRLVISTFLSLYGLNVLLWPWLLLNLLQPTIWNTN